MKKEKREKVASNERRDTEKSARDVIYENEQRETQEQIAATQKEKEKKSKTRWRFADLVAFLALTFSALMFVLGPFIRWIMRETTGGEQAYDIMTTIAQYSLLAAIALPAWYFVRGKSFFWIILYIVVIVIYLIGTILGLI